MTYYILKLGKHSILRDALDLSDAFGSLLQIEPFRVWIGYDREFGDASVPASSLDFLKRLFSDTLTDGLRQQPEMVQDGVVAPTLDGKEAGE